MFRYFLHECRVLILVTCTFLIENLKESFDICDLVSVGSFERDKLKTGWMIFLICNYTLLRKRAACSKQINLSTRSQFVINGYIHICVNMGKCCAKPLSSHENGGAMATAPFFFEKHRKEVRSLVKEFLPLSLFLLDVPPLGIFPENWITVYYEAEKWRTRKWTEINVLTLTFW